MNQETIIAQVQRKLFDELGVDNIKLFPGEKRHAKREDIAKELLRSISRLEAGNEEE